MTGHYLGTLLLLLLEGIGNKQPHGEQNPCCQPAYTVGAKERGSIPFPLVDENKMAHDCRPLAVFVVLSIENVWQQIVEPTNSYTYSPSHV